MPSNEINRRKIFKNTVMLYVRLLFSTIISLYTSRVVLNQLGVNDYGIYSLVGGIVLIFSFLNASMSAATSRFITVEITNGDENTLKETFNVALITHIIIAGIVLILAETVGLWFVLNKLNIENHRMTAALWVYQLSVASSLVSITQVPYNSSLIAHENMGLFAYIDILSSVLKLGVALLLYVAFFDSLIFYAVFIFIVSVIIASLYRIVCIRKYKECRFQWKWNKEIGKSLLNFSGWNLYAQGCFVGRQQGTNILLNIFGGTAVNAAAGLATTIQNIIEQGATNLVMAARPQIIGQYTLKKYSDMIKLMGETNILANLLYCIVVIPFTCEIDFILTLWLKNVPPYTVQFCICIFIMNFISLNNNILNIGVQAIGKIRNYSLASGTCSILVIPISWFLLKAGLSLVWAFIIPIFTSLLIYIISTINLSLYIKNFNPFEYFARTFLKTLLVCIPCIVFMIYIRMQLPASYSRALISIISIFLLFLSLSFIFLLNKKMKIKLLNKLKLKFNLG